MAKIDTIALNILYVKHNTKKISVVYRSKDLHLSALLQKISSNLKKDFYCLSCVNSYTTRNKLKEHVEICDNHSSCHIEMPEWVNKLIKHNLGEKSLINHL